MLKTIQTTLEANLKALRACNAEAAARVEAADEHPGYRPLVADDGLTTGEIVVQGGAQGLSSRRRPGEEARRIAEGIDLTGAAVVVVLGFGAGHHVREIARHVGGTGLVVVFEPDVSLLRSVLGSIDQSTWLGSSNLRVLTDGNDRAAMVEAIRGCEGLIGMGLTIVEHAPSSARLSEAGKTFAKRLTEVVESTKMTVLTSLVQVRTTVRNATQNLDRYVQSPGVAELAGACSGRAGIVVSAGPSLSRNVHLLTRPGLRDRCVIVAVQTVIKPLLERGIKPHFVTALDHSEISRRFYEGLTAADVEGITLVAEPKVNPAVIEAWPGALRMVGDATLDRILGELATGHGALTAGATVAHLAYYLARHLGCDPVALIGQDLGFTDGQYYAPGAAIHQTWGSELNEFNTLEMMEWQRIMRMGPHLRRATDVLGREVFTDEQMQAYLSQFERDFKRDAAKGLTTIDASEGGVQKQHAATMRLEEFIEREWDRHTEALTLPPASSHADARATLKRLDERVREVRQKVWRVGQLCTKAEGLLTEVIEHHEDQPRVNRLIGRLDAVTREVVSLEPAYALTHTLAQTGAFNRVRADRLIHLDHTLDEFSRQRRQGERDLANVRTLHDTAEDLGAMLDRAIATINGGPRQTSETAASGVRRGGKEEQGDDAQRRTTDSAAKVTSQALIAIVPVIEATRAPGRLDVLQREGGVALLARVLNRVALCRLVGAVVVATDRREECERVVSERGLSSRVRVVEYRASDGMRFRARQMWAARSAARSCWRGGLLGATAFDEVFDPVMAHELLEAHSAEACVCVDATWAALDPELTDRIIARFLDDAEGQRLTFSQAPPGLAPCVIHRTLVAQLVAGEAKHTAQASVGALLAYNPLAPVNDLIASTRCVHVEPALRDSGVRLQADSVERAAALAKGLATTSAGHSATARFAMMDAARMSVAPDELVVHAGDPGAKGAIAEFGREGAGRLVTLRTNDDTSLGSCAAPTALESLVAVAREHRLCTHVRTHLRSDAERDRLFDITPEIVSVDLLADSEHTYFKMTDRGDYGEIVQRVHALIAARASVGRPKGILFVVPRIERCDLTYAEIETFYHRWLHVAGWAVIDPPTARHSAGSARITPLPLPSHAQRRLHLSRRVVGGGDHS